MNGKLQVTSDMWQVTRTGTEKPYRVTRHMSRVTACHAEATRRRAFTLVEMLVTLVLLSFIVLALMAVFNSTQNAFRAGLTETDILESGRFAMDLIEDDVSKTTPGYGFSSVTNLFGNFSGYEPFLFGSNTVNFYIRAFPDNFPSGSPPNLQVQHQPFIQYLPGTSAKRTNVLEDFFMLTRGNINGRPSWIGIGYAVDLLSWPTNSLYRFVMITNVSRGNPFGLFTSFTNDVYANVVNQAVKRGNPFTNTVRWTHLMDGIVDLRVRPYDPYGLWMTNYWDYYKDRRSITNLNTYFYWPLAPGYPDNATPGVSGCIMYSNMVPAAVEVDMGVLENDTLLRAEALGVPGTFIPPPSQVNYLSNHVGQVHVFRKRIWVRNVDLTAYQ